MPCVTYLGGNDLDRHAPSLNPVTDKDLADLLAEINSFPGQLWSLRKGRLLKRRLFRRAKRVEWFSLYCYLSGPEWQCIHFPTGSNGDGTFTLTRKEMATFLLGFRMGWQDRGRQPGEAGERLRESGAA